MALKEIDPDVLALLAALIAADLAHGMDLEEQNVFGNFIVAVGSIILTMAAAREAQKKAQEEAKAKTEEAKAKTEETKKKEPTAGEKKTGQSAEAKASSQEPVRREEYSCIRSEQELLKRRLGDLERLMVAHVGPAK